jgi:hypothetical protein
MSHHPPTYSHSTDPLDTDDWLKPVTKKLERAQCNDREMVLYGSGCLERLASDWWDAYSAAHPAPNTITWQQFRDAFRAHHIPDGVLKLKQREFLALKQGNMSVNEYLDKFTQLSRYGPDEVNTDSKRKERFSGWIDWATELPASEPYLSRLRYLVKQGNWLGEQA